MMKKGYLSFVFHSHLPYVLSHGEWPHGMDWIYEAAAETYIPLLIELSELVNSGISPAINIGFTPILCEQLKDERFATGFSNYLEMKLNSAIKNEEEFRFYNDEQRASLAKFWYEFYERILNAFELTFDRDIISAFRRLQEDGHIEILTSAATHGYLPLIGEDQCIQAQIRIGARAYFNTFGKKPRGIWLPECGYRPSYLWSSPLTENDEKKLRAGIEFFLSNQDIEYFIIDSHLLRGGKAIGVYMERFEALKRLWEQASKHYREQPIDEEKSPYSVYLLHPENENPVAVFTRDPQTGLQVWSGQWGYPGNGVYLDFHKKHFPGGLRYWRVTDFKADLADKIIYDPSLVDYIIKEQAAHFVSLVKGILTEYYQKHNLPGVVCAPFDTELFGHWWFEGPRWLAEVIRLFAKETDFALSTCSDHLDRISPSIIISLPEGSWGEGGFHYIWLNQDTQWTWRHIYKCESEFLKMLKKSSAFDHPILDRALLQAGRELLLLESSDWQFLITTFSARDYAEARFLNHLDSFNRLMHLVNAIINQQMVDEGALNFLENLEKIDGIFPDLSLKDWMEER